MSRGRVASPVTGGIQTAAGAGAGAGAGASAGAAVAATAAANATANADDGDVIDSVSSQLPSNIELYM